MDATVARLRWRFLAPTIVVPFIVMTGVMLFVWTPGHAPSDSTLATWWPFVLALGAGLPFAWRMSNGAPVLRAGIVCAYIVLGLLALPWFTIAFSCVFRDVCL